MTTFKDVLNEMNDLYEKKNADYGDSFSKTFEEFGPIAAAIRFNDKIERFKNLILNEAQVKSETLEDTAMDLANYAALTVLEFKKREVQS